MTLPTTRLIEKEQIAEGTMAFRFAKPEGFTYQAGQFADYTLIDPPETDGEGNTRGFTLASAPYEPFLMCATRMRDTAFKRVLKDMPVGTELTLDAPYGSFTLHHNIARPAVFLTGGIGITPVRSIALQSVRDKSGHRIFAFHSNRRPEDAPFLDEMVRLGESEDSIVFVPTMTKPEDSERAWEGETGHIDKEMISKHIKDLTAPIYYLCGPRSMVAAMRSLLKDMGADEDDIRTEEFAGY
ncbi:ferredoxin--NADP reductase [Sinomonas terrae]|uniref:FAD-dependent oxidoreductase n=1 Tax=Sinomonas terrae TaxID=2908838 RepID=A0ABS9U7G6_9MICC|nr:FAD-dependent oxidoreductase [Sinomonas terrae]MCH6472481.1 FAD-dependent oxidoreductase [Sinomonas terrae]